MTSQKNTSIFDFNMQNSYAKITNSHKNQSKSKKYGSHTAQSLIFSISVPNLVTIGRHVTSFLTCATFNMQKAYTHILVFYFSAINRDIDLKCIQDTYWVVINSLKKN